MTLIKSILKKEKIDAILISSHASITYLTSYSNFAKEERDAFVVITKSANFLITDKRYSNELKETVKGFEILDMGASRFLKDGLQEFCKSRRIKSIGFEDEDLSVWEFNQITLPTKAVDLAGIREIKEQWEIKKIKKACQIGDEAFSFILPHIKEGVSEKEIALKLETFIRSHADDISFPSIVAFGKNSAVPHHMTDTTKLKKNQIVLMDFGVKYHNYCSDMTRTVFLGKVSDEYKKLYNTVHHAQAEAIKSIKPGVKASSIDVIARGIIKSNKLAFNHSLGHGIGIEVHETPHISPLSNDILKNGMVFSIEPGCYIEGLGGIRIEDLVFVKNDKAELISHANRGIIEL